jgi:hypothetical protein
VYKRQRQGQGADLEGREKGGHEVGGIGLGPGLGLEVKTGRVRDRVRDRDRKSKGLDSRRQEGQGS